jgi:hypothetical protein
MISRPAKPSQDSVPPAARSQLDTAIAGVNVAAGTLGDLVSQERRRRRITTALLVLAMLVGAVNYQSDKLSACKSANTSRAEIHQGFQILADTLVPIEFATPEQQAEKDAFMRSIREGLPTKDCSFL